MAYATLQDLIDRFGEREIIELTDRADPPADAADPDVAGAALTSASSVIDGFVAVRYGLPLAVTPALLVEICCDLARARLYRDQITEVVEGRRKDALMALRDIASGKMLLDVAGAEPAADGNKVYTDGAERVFTSTSMTGF